MLSMLFLRGESLDAHTHTRTQCLRFTARVGLFVFLVLSFSFARTIAHALTRSLVHAKCTRCTKRYLSVYSMSSSGINYSRFPSRNYLAAVSYRLAVCVFWSQFFYVTTNRHSTHEQPTTMVKEAKKTTRSLCGAVCCCC